MNIYVVTLKASPKRRAVMRAQLDTLGLAAQFVDGIDGGELMADDLRRDYDERRCLAMPSLPRWRPGPMGCGAIGVALSHLEVYRRIASSDVGPALVLEDDAVLSPELPAMLEAVGRKMEKTDVVLLYHRVYVPFPFSLWGRETLGVHALIRASTPHAFASTVAYVITPAVAARMVRALYPVHTVSDHWGYFHELGLFERLRIVVPRPVMHNDALPSVQKQRSAQAPRREAVRGSAALRPGASASGRLGRRIAQRCSQLKREVQAHVAGFVLATVPQAGTRLAKRILPEPR